MTCKRKNWAIEQKKYIQNQIRILSSIATDCIILVQAKAKLELINELPFGHVIYVIYICIKFRMPDTLMYNYLFLYVNHSLIYIIYGIYRD